MYEGRLDSPASATQMLYASFPYFSDAKLISSVINLPTTTCLVRLFSQLKSHSLPLPQALFAIPTARKHLTNEDWRERSPEVLE